MGIILALLILANHLPSDADVPMWVVLSGHTAIGLGTMFGGWRIVQTMGSKITKLQPVGCATAEGAAALTRFATSFGGIPVSTTPTITGAIVGVGSARRPRLRTLGSFRLAEPGPPAVATADPPHDPVRHLGVLVELAALISEVPVPEFRIIPMGVTDSVGQVRLVKLAISDRRVHPPVVGLASEAEYPTRQRPARGSFPPVDSGPPSRHRRGTLGDRTWAP